LLDWEKFKDDYKDQKVIDDRSKSYNSLIKLFKQYEGFDMSSIYLIDAYGSLIMKYQKDAKPKGIIKDIERLIRVAP
jgi:cytochrome oxidase Cu insertion factor (SCO1/SenC/PrrC family)